MEASERQRRIGVMAAKLAGDEGLEGFEAARAPSRVWIERAKASDQEKEHARRAVKKLARNQPLLPPEMGAFEAIIMPEGRPVVDVVNDSFKKPPSPWEHLALPATKKRIVAALPAIGRVEAPEHPQLPYVGTGFIVGDGLLMTNRHVAEVFVTGLGLHDLAFRPGLDLVDVDFKREVVPTAPVPFRVKKVLMVHPFWDMALLQTENLGKRHRLTLAAIEPDDLRGRDVVIVGYPALDPRNDIALQNRIFGGVFQVKRLQPGKATGRRTTRSFGHDVPALTHDASTLGGNSGSAIVDVASGNVVGLHFGGVYLDTNYAVPAYELKRDPYVVDLGVSFSKDTVPTDPDWASAWDSLETSTPPPPPANGASTTPIIVTSGGATPPANGSTPLARNGHAVGITIPLHVMVSLGEAGTAQATSISVDGAGATADETTAIDPNWTDRVGYDPDFIGVPVPLPKLSAAQKKITAVVPTKYRRDKTNATLLNYHHYSLAFNLVRRQAWYSAANIDGDRRFKFDRGTDHWYIDPRLEEGNNGQQRQMGEELYATAETDRGHLTRYLDVAWGDGKADAIDATNDTFHFSNCSLQLSGFNQGKDRWQGIEQYLLEQKARKEKRRMSVITGPVFKADDPVYRNKYMSYSIRVPLQFWKVCALQRQDGSLAITAFVLGQPDIANLPGFEERFDVTATQLTVAALEKLTGLDFGTLKKHDHFAHNGAPGSLELVGAPARGPRLRAKPLTTVEDIVL